MKNIKRINSLAISNIYNIFRKLWQKMKIMLMQKLCNQQSKDAKTGMIFTKNIVYQEVMSKIFFAEVYFLIIYSIVFYICK